MTLAPDLDLQQMLTRERHRIHLIGVAGSGMSGIAALLLELGTRRQRLGQSEILGGRAIAAARAAFSNGPSPRRRAGCRARDLFFRDSGRRIRSARPRRWLVSRSCAAPKRSRRSWPVNAGSSSPACMARPPLQRWRRMFCARAVCIRRITSARRFRSSAQTRIGIRAANISWRKAMRVTGPCVFSNPSTRSSSTLKKSISIFMPTWRRSRRSFASCSSKPAARLFIAPTTLNSLRICARHAKPISLWILRGGGLSRDRY